jgi:hypothetical protein
MIFASCLSHSVEILRELQFWDANVIWGNLSTGRLYGLELLVITSATRDGWTPVLARLTAPFLGERGHVDYLILSGRHLSGVQNV